MCSVTRILFLFLDRRRSRPRRRVRLLDFEEEYADDKENDVPGIPKVSALG